MTSYNSSAEEATSETPAKQEKTPAASEKSSTLTTYGALPAASAIGAMQDPTKPAKKVNAALTMRRMLTAGLVLPLFMIVVLPLLMTGMISNVSPRHMDVAVIGAEANVQEMVDSLDTQTAGSFDVGRYDNIDDAHTALEEHEIRAAYDPADATLYYAGANGKQVTAAVTQLFTPVAQQSQMELKTTDIAPLDEDDPSGSTVTYLALGAILGGMMTGLLTALMPTGSKSRIVIGIIMPAVVATIEVLYGWAVFGIFDGSAVDTWFMLFMLGITCLSVTSGLLLLAGPVMLPVAILLTAMMGMPASGVSAPLDMINGFYGWVHQWLFSAQGIAGIRDSIYFENAPMGQHFGVMVIWFLIGLALAIFGTVKQKRRHLFALTPEQEYEVATAAVAVAP